VASRTLDNITGVLVSFKNFRKTLKNELAGVEKARLPDAYRQATLNQLLALPNGDLTWEDIEKPDSASRSEVSVDNMAKIPNSSSAPPGRLNSSQNRAGGSVPRKGDSSQITKRPLPGAGTGGS
jgi:hypothetical protein